MARPTKYKPEYAEKARKLCLLGATDEALADFFEVDVSTISNWKNDFPLFLEALKKGKAQADAEVAASLYHRANGYSHKAVKMFCFEGQVISEEYTEHYPPDTTAAIFWLKNRQPKQWRDKQPGEDDKTVTHKGEVTVNQPDLEERINQINQVKVT